MPIITVSQLNNYMKRYIERNVQLSDLWIKGEISNFKKHYSGHIYMTLKDETSSVRAVMFKPFADLLKFKPADGSKIIAYGKISVYERDGVYQLYVQSLIPDGVGELYAAYEQLKFRLEAEGLFDDAYKKKIPNYPKCIGVISSSSGAAMHDILNVISRRYKLCKIKIYNAKVQGFGSSDSVCEALQYFSIDEEIDLIILARGGGSIEDLWAFNEEKTVRAIFNCTKPVITGIGHETDYTISDFVADMRAPTPSAAAELATPSSETLFRLLNDMKHKLHSSLTYQYNEQSSRLQIVNKTTLLRLMEGKIAEVSHELSNLLLRIGSSFDKFSAGTAKKLGVLSTALEVMNPRKVLERGYTITVDLHDTPVSVKDIEQGDCIKVIFDKGYAMCEVDEVKHE